MVDFIILAVVLAALALVTYRLVRRKQKGGSQCAGCSGCAHASSCASADETNTSNN